MRTWGMSCTGRHSSRIIYLLECVFTLEHCICTYGPSGRFTQVMDYIEELGYML